MDKKYRLKSLEDISRYSREFAVKRKWTNYQSPKNIVMALSVECAELVEHFQWLTEQESKAIDAEKKRDVGHEMADILFYLVRVADELDIDLCEAASEKALLNDRKYPVIDSSLV